MKEFKTKGLIIILVLSAVFLAFEGGKMTERRIKTEANPYPKLHSLEELIDNNFLFETDPTKIEEGVYKGLFQGLDDPYSTYMNPDEYKKLMESASGEYAGVGLVVSAGEDNMITVVSPIEGSPAAEKDLRTGDKIIAVDGERFLGSELDQAVDIMRGEPGTPVKLTIQRISDDENKIFDLEILREKINLVTVRSDKLGNIGYLSISQFDEHTFDDFLEKKQALEEEKVDSLIIDLRGNPGGLLSSVVKIADELLPEGPIVKTVNKNGQELIEGSQKSHDQIPLVVLINKGSASASEILAGAIQDYQRGPIVGENSFGKGIVQQIFPLGDGSGVKLTISEYFTPKDHKIHEIGVKPDYEISLPEEVQGLGPDFLDQDTQLQKAVELLK